MRYFLDANIFMYAAGREHPLKAPCVAALKRAALEKFEAFTNTEILQEILYRYSAIGEFRQGLRLARLAMEQIGGEVLPVTLADMRHAFELVERHGAKIKARDAVHAATMLNNGLTHIISADSHFDIIRGITRVNPVRVRRL